MAAMAKGVAARPQPGYSAQEVHAALQMAAEALSVKSNIISELRRQVAATGQQAESAAQADKAQLADRQACIAALETERQAHAAALAVQMARVQALEREADAHKAELAELRRTAAETAELTAHEADRDSVRGDAALLAQALASRDARLAALEADCKALQADCEARLAAKEQVAATLAEREAHIATLEADNQQMSQVLDTLQTFIGTANEAIEPPEPEDEQEAAKRFTSSLSYWAARLESAAKLRSARPSPHGNASGSFRCSPRGDADAANCALQAAIDAAAASGDSTWLSHGSPVRLPQGSRLPSAGSPDGSSSSRDSIFMSASPSSRASAGSPDVATKAPAVGRGHRTPPPPATAPAAAGTKQLQPSAASVRRWESGSKIKALGRAASMGASLPRHFAAVGSQGRGADFAATLMDKLNIRSPKKQEAAGDV